MENKNQNQINFKFSLPPDGHLIVARVMKKYGLEEEQKRGIEKLFQSKGEEFEKIFESLPGRKIARLIAQIALGEIEPQELPVYLEKNLNLPKEKAWAMAKDLLWEFFSLPLWGKEVPKTPEKETPKAPPPPPPKRDIYREPIE